MKNIFDPAVSKEMIDRIGKISANSVRQWGTMDPASMLAHCNVTYEMIYEDKHPRAGTVKRFFLRLLIKPFVVSDKPYKPGSRTAPEFIMKGDKDLEAEKKRLIGYIEKTQSLGKVYFHDKSSNSFGMLTGDEWNALFYKHLDHHLRQFSA